MLIIGIKSGVNLIIFPESQVSQKSDSQTCVFGIYQQIDQKLFFVPLFSFIIRSPFASNWSIRFPTT
jgi:hypothetical protein